MFLYNESNKNLSPKEWLEKYGLIEKVWASGHKPMFTLAEGEPKKFLDTLKNAHSDFLKALNDVLLEYRNLCSSDLEFSKRMESRRLITENVEIYYFDGVPVFKIVHENGTDKVAWTIVRLSS